MITFTDRARKRVLEFLEDSEGELEALRIRTDAGSPLAPTYELSLVSGDDRSPSDVTLDGGGFDVLVDGGTAPTLTGATVDFVERVNEAGFEVRPAPESGGLAPAAGSPPSTTGPLADKVRAVLDTQINPAVASHGGHIGLAGVEGTEVYIEMLGGCQGCSLSRMTLRQGVERMIRDSVPEVTAIHDVTDHASGENPFFTG